MSLGIASMYVYYAATYSTIQDLVEPSLRGMAMAIYFFAMYLFGASLGPYATGFLSDMYTTDAARAAGITELTPAALEPFKGAGLLKAMQIIPVFNVLLAGCMFAASRTVGKDLNKLHTWMKAAAAREAAGARG